jgi:hypothetical protein
MVTIGDRSIHSHPGDSYIVKIDDELVKADFGEVRKRCDMTVESKP